MRNVLIPLVAVVILSACQSERETSMPAPAVTTSPAGSAAVPAQDEAERIAEELHRHIPALASDEFMGRRPGTRGEELTVNYLAREFEALGLAPGNSGDWFQAVPITTVKPAPGVTLELRGAEYSADLSYGEQMAVSTPRQVEQVTLDDSPLVFVGYGINAPERNWNDYADVDVTGKTVVVLINDPGFATQDPQVFNGNAMTYYGRWTYKYEEAARQGAAGILIVHETAPAGYGWEVVRNGFTGPRIGLTAENGNAHRAAIEGWLPVEQAQALFAAAGLDYRTQADAAARPGFKAVELGDITASVTLDNTLESTTTRNVLALLEGSTHPDEVIIYTAHWDHLGVHADEEGDNIYNGASDNASGTAALLSLARMFRQQARPPERSIVFLAVTAEESGLLGSKWYGENPVYPLDRTVANFNMDNIAAGTVGLTRDIAVVGFGNSELEKYLAEAAEAQGRTPVQEPFPEKGFYYRSDHFSLARVGVPALYLTRSTDSVAHGREWGEKRISDYIAQHYHKPSDEYDPSWDLTGAVQEIQLLHHMGRSLASNRDFPRWTPGVEFEAVREASLASGNE
jgi:Zn-dependent M28 family amino/carboxypeptidase